MESLIDLEDPLETDDQRARRLDAEWSELPGNPLETS